MWHVLIFYCLFLGALAYATGWGGAPERIFALMCVLGFVVSMWVRTPWPYEFRHVELGLLLVDVAMFCALYVMSIFSTRFWPIWMTAMQGLSVLAHMMVLTPQPSAFGYQVLEEFWSFPQLTLLIVAVRRHRLRLARNGTDPSWTVSFARSGPPIPR